MAEAAIKTIEREILEEEYAHSLSTFRRWGSTAVQATVELENSEALEQLARDDFTTAVTEMLKTDAEFRDYLDIDVNRTHAVHEDKVRAADGRPMVELVRAGALKSTRAALQQPELEPQATRDAGDLFNAEKVDELAVGMTRFAVSMVPSKALKKFPRTYAELGYRDGLTYVQSYSRIDEATLITGSYSVDMSDEATWRKLLEDIGQQIPADEPVDSWIRYGFELPADADAAKDFVYTLRKEYYRRRGADRERYSVSEYVAKHNAIVDQYFNSYYPVLAEAIYSGQNDERLQAMAAAVLQADVSRFKPEVRNQLVRIANSRHFDDEAGRVMDSVIRYALVEELRQGLQLAQDATIEPVADVIFPINNLPLEFFHQRLALNVANGIRAGRSYGGCAGQIELGIEARDEQGAGSGPQDAYGGEQGADSESSADGICEYVHDGCYCCAYNKDGSKRGSRLKVKARREANGIAYCKRDGCGAWLAKDGSGDIGNIARKAQARQEEQQATGLAAGV